MVKFIRFYTRIFSYMYHANGAFKTIAKPLIATTEHMSMGWPRSRPLNFPVTISGTSLLYWSALLFFAAKKV